MTPSQKLEALIERAIENGWDCFDRAGSRNVRHKGKWEIEYEDVENKLSMSFWNIGRTRIYEHRVVTVSENDILFNHDFAKALVGESPFADSGDKFMGIPVMTGIPAYEYLLQQAVILDSTDAQISYMYNVVFGKDEK